MKKNIAIIMGIAFALICSVAFAISTEQAQAKDYEDSEQIEACAIVKTMYENEWKNNIREADAESKIHVDSVDVEFFAHGENHEKIFRVHSILSDLDTHGVEDVWTFVSESDLGIDL